MIRITNTNPDAVVPVCVRRLGRAVAFRWMDREVLLMEEASAFVREYTCTAHERRRIVAFNL